MNNTTPYSRTMSGLTDIVANSITTDTLVLDSLSAQDIVCNTLSAATSVDTPLLTGSGNLDFTYVGGIYSACNEYNINTTAGYGGIAFASAFDIDLQAITNGKINLIGKVNQSTGTNNVSYGKNSMIGTQSGTNNTAVAGLKNLTSGSFNVSIGENSGLNISSGVYNTSCGYNSLTISNGNANTAMGYNSLKVFQGTNTSSYGYDNLKSLTTGSVCSSFGAGACAAVTTADAVNGFGFLALSSCTTGLQNCAFGYYADALLTIGSANCTYGNISGCTNASNNVYSGNTCIGYSVQTSGGSYNTYLGYNANSGVFRTFTNFSTGIGYNATPEHDHEIRLGTAAEYVYIPNALEVVNYINVPTASPGTNNTNVATTEYVDRAVTDNNTYLLSTTNAWTGTNSFNTNLPTSTLTPTLSSQLTTKAYVDSIGGVSLSGTNAWTGTNSFNTNLPTSTLTPASGTQLVTKTYADTKGGLTSANAWTSTNTFNTNLPTSTQTPSSGTQLVTKTYTDGLITDIDAYNKTITITDDFLTGLNNTNVQWTNTITGAGTGAVQASIVNHPGLFRIGTSTTIGSSSGIAMSQSSIFTNNIATIEWIWRYNTNFNNSVIQIGYANAINTFTISACFRLQISPTNYQFVVNGTPTYTINKEPLLFGLLVNKWLHGKIIIDFTAGTQAFQLTNLTDGVTESDTTTAAITSSAITPICKISQLGATASTIDVDYCRFKYTTSSRT